MLVSMTSFSDRRNSPNHGGVPREPPTTVPDSAVRFATRALAALEAWTDHAIAVHGHAVVAWKPKPLTIAPTHRPSPPRVPPTMPRALPERRERPPVWIVDRWKDRPFAYLLLVDGAWWLDSLTRCVILVCGRDIDVRVHVGGLVASCHFWSIFAALYFVNTKVFQYIVHEPNFGFLGAYILESWPVQLVCNRKLYGSTDLHMKNKVGHGAPPALAQVLLYCSGPPFDTIRALR